jgi:hypothetical protein
VELLISICMGIGLAAACGLRVFLPLVALSVGTKLGIVTPGAGWEWIGSTGAVVGLSVAASVEIAGYYVPWIDHALDALATPLAVVAGAFAAMATMGVVSELPPMVSHGMALLTGGAAAGAVQATSVVARAASTVTTGGLMNPVVSTIENVVSAVLSVLAVVIPIVAGVVLLLIAVLLVRRWTRRAPLPA